MTTCNDPIEFDSSCEPVVLAADPLILSHSNAQLFAMRRIARAFVRDPETVLQELVDTAVTLCGADSAGILVALEPDSGSQSDANAWKCVAASGKYALSRDIAAPVRLRGLSLEPGNAQHYSSVPRFFELIGLESASLTDAVLLPWQSGNTRGVLWIATESATRSFQDGDSANLMQTLADFATMAVRQQQQQNTLVEEAAASAVADMANDLAHQINNPLQAMTNVAYLAAEGQSNGDTRTLGRTLSSELKRLSALVNKLLALPGRTAL